jgi:hypothetical protein
MWGDHSRREYNCIMLGASVLFAVVIMGVTFSLFEDLMNVLIFGAVALVIANWLYRRIQEACKWHHVMHASVEELIEEELEHSRPTILKREYPHNDCPEP